jgi:hypothetical protein
MNDIDIGTKDHSMHSDTKREHDTTVALSSLRLGDVSMVRSGAQLAFVILMGRTLSPTKARLEAMVAAAQDNGYRVVRTQVVEGNGNPETMRITVRSSERTVGKVSRVSRDPALLRTYVTLEGPPPVAIWRIMDHMTLRPLDLMMTSPGDEVEIWQDVVNGGLSSAPSMFVNRTAERMDMFLPD